MNTQTHFPRGRHSIEAGVVSTLPVRLKARGLEAISREESDELKRCERVIDDCFNRIADDFRKAARHARRIQDGRLYRDRYHDWAEYCRARWDKSGRHLQCIECGTSYCRGDAGGCGLTARPMQCRGCGCTADKACATASGETCYWIEPYLCSACAEHEAGGKPSAKVVISGPGELHMTEADVMALLSLQPMLLRLPPQHAFELLSALQLTLRHPNLPPNTRLMITRLAGALEESISVTPNLAAVCRAGWDSSLDGPAEGVVLVPT